MNAGPSQSDSSTSHEARESDRADDAPASQQNGVASPSDPLAAVLEQTEDRSAADPSRAINLPAGRDGHNLSTQEVADALCRWFDLTSADSLPSSERLIAMLSEDIAELDHLLNDQVNAIIHHSRFQSLEAAWRGVWNIVEQIGPHSNIQVKMLNVSWKDITRDLTRAVEFDQSQLFRKVYEDGIGTPGGHPFSVLIGDYQIGRSAEDIETLQGISGVAAAAFAPFIASAHPSLFDLEHFGEFERQIDLSRTFSQADYIAWRSFRDTEDARFVGLTLPRTLMRLPYGTDPARRDAFIFREQTDHPDGSGYLWGNPAFAYATVLIRAFTESGWLADVRGVRRDEAGGGLVQNLPVHSFDTDRLGVATKSSTDVAITDQQEKQLGELGFIPLCHCPDTEYACFYGSQSVQSPKSYTTAAATANARISSMLHYMLCASRFAHYLKVLARDKVGSMIPPEQLQGDLTNWISQYVRDDDDAAISIKARFPLREAKVRVIEYPDQPGTYSCDMHLLPHFQLDSLSASLRLNTELSAPKSA